MKVKSILQLISNPIAYQNGLIFFGIIVCALALGFIAASGNLQLALFTAGIFVLALAFLNLEIAILSLIALGLGGGAFIDLGGNITARIPWASSIFSLALVPLSLFIAFWQPARKHPAYIKIAVFFIFYSIFVSFLFSTGGIIETIGGVKRVFQGYGIMFALAILGLSAQGSARLQRIVYWVALLQLPFCLIQLFVLVPLRGGIASGGGQATDVVAGTFGANMSGGSAGSAMLIYVLIMFAAALCRFRQGIISGNSALLFATIILAPLILGESKIIIFWLPFVLLIVYFDMVRRAPTKFLVGAIFTLLAIFALAEFYATAYLNLDLAAAVEDTIRYNFGEKVGYGVLLLNRTTSITFWWNQHSPADFLNILFGHGLGSSYSTTNNMGAGSVGALYPMYGINLTTISTLLWDVGVVGISLFLAMHFFALRIASRLRALAASPRIRADATTMQVAIGLSLAAMPYNDMQVNLIVTETIFAVCFGYLALLQREFNEVKY